ncbi:glycosyltransferase family 39 protein [Hyalangium versicolor]|uniref:glycosyltransferase family 39 protein n=1 Tax=Hyalangium versicolor TaxID=2861190 RepID=UPI001CC9C4FE|nr:glycosyltransferase family 39 protein [Hyalangium versicolor]
MERAWERRGVWVLALVAVAAGVLRLIPLVRTGGALGYPIDYDEGVYFSASALFFQGHWPYRDFVFVHPPGSIWLLGPSALVGSWMGFDAGFALSRWMATVCGALSVLLAGRLSMRVWGPVAGVVTALAYATYPEAVFVERGPFLEPLLNVACLAAANAWLAEPRLGREEPRWLLAGVFFGLAVCVKVLGGIWLFAALLARPPWPRWMAHAGMVLVAAGVVALLVGPFVLQAPLAFFSQVFVFHGLLPPDGELSQLGRMHELFHERRLVGMALALMGLVLVAVRAFRNAEPTRPAERLVAVAYILTITAFLSSPSYWNQYNTYLAASESILAGLGAAAVYQWLTAWRPRHAGVVAGALCVAVVLPTVRFIRGGLRLKERSLPVLGQYIRQSVPPGAQLFAFEPAWGIVGGRLPTAIAGAPLVVDSYALMLRGALATGQPFGQTVDALRTPAAQQAIREVLERSRFVVMGWRGDWQLSEESKQWFRARFTRRFPAPGQGGPDLWEQNPQ